MRKRNSKLCSAAALTLALLAITSVGKAADTNAPVPPKTPDKFAEIFGDPLVAKGKGVEVKRSQVNEAIINYKAALAAEGRTASAADLRILERRIVDQLIANQLILAKASDEDRRKGKEEVANALQKFKTENKITDEDFEEKILAPRLRAQGVALGVEVAQALSRELPQHWGLPRRRDRRHRQAHRRADRAGMAAHRRLLVSAWRHPHRRVLAARHAARGRVDS